MVICNGPVQDRAASERMSARHTVAGSKKTAAFLPRNPAVDMLSPDA